MLRIKKNGYCHYDFLPKNFHFTAANTITFFDFDFAGKGLLANDITSFYIHFFLETYYQKITQQQADERFAVFVKAYRSVRPLTESELKTISYLGFAFWVFYLGFQYDSFEDWSNFFFGPKFLKERVALLKKWTEWYCIW
jgi:Ser/Thr protein kinase RdoA (MazF antagonist)